MFLPILILHIKKMTILILLLNITEATPIEESEHHQNFEDSNQVEERERNLTTTVLNYLFFKCKTTITVTKKKKKAQKTAI